jgi:transposase
MQEDPSFRARSRAHSLLLSAEGMTIKAIAKTYQVHRVTVSAWIQKWEQHGVQSLHDQPRSGRPSKLTPDEAVREVYPQSESAGWGTIYQRLIPSVGQTVLRPSLRSLESLPNGYNSLFFRMDGRRFELPTSALRRQRSPS